MPRWKCGFTRLLIRGVSRVLCAECVMGVVHYSVLMLDRIYGVRVMCFVAVKQSIKHISVIPSVAEV